VVLGELLAGDHIGAGFGDGTGAETVEKRWREMGVFVDGGISMAVVLGVVILEGLVGGWILGVASGR
jgi:hypothetical protein